MTASKAAGPSCTRAKGVNIRQGICMIAISIEPDVLVHPNESWSSLYTIQSKDCILLVHICVANAEIPNRMAFSLVLIRDISSAICIFVSEKGSTPALSCHTGNHCLSYSENPSR